MLIPTPSANDAALNKVKSPLSLSTFISVSLLDLSPKLIAPLTPKPVNVPTLVIEPECCVTLPLEILAFAIVPLEIFEAFKAVSPLPLPTNPLIVPVNVGSVNMTAFDSLVTFSRLS